MISDEAKTSMYASIANCTSGVPARNDAEILGTAVLMMELSADTMKRLRYAVPTTPKVRDIIFGRLAVSDIWFSIFSKACGRPLTRKSTASTKVQMPGS
ncbi:hypothetical protein [Streptomyces sp. NPDC059161]|uniref:hypothetical protein n=1 Tax=unclassified Streptomyces TaxID=2593676 RepID=UPI0036522F25